MQDIFSHNEHRVRLLYVLDRGRRQGGTAKDPDHRLHETGLLFCDALVERIRPDQRAQGIVGFERRARTPNSDRASMCQSRHDCVQHIRLIPWFQRLCPRPAHQRAAQALVAVHEFVAESASITEKIAVDPAVVTVHDAPQHAVPLAR